MTAREARELALAAPEGGEDGALVGDTERALALAEAILTAQGGSCAEARAR